MKRPTEEDFKSHALMIQLKGLGMTDQEKTISAIKFGYQLALQHAGDEVAKATEDLIKFRAKSNAPQ